jgi:hypothetical protein
MQELCKFLIGRGYHRDCAYTTFSKLQEIGWTQMFPRSEINMGKCALRVLSDTGGKIMNAMK